MAVIVDVPAVNDLTVIGHLPSAPVAQVKGKIVSAAALSLENDMITLLLLSEVVAVIVEVRVPSAGNDGCIAERDNEGHVGASFPSQSLSILSASQAGSGIGVYSLFGT